MTLTLFESVQRIVHDGLAAVRTTELATVSGDHTADGRYACDVVLRDSQLVLKEVPVATGRIGSVAIPAVGELVLVQFIAGDVNAPVVVGRLYNDADAAPANGDGHAVVHLPLGAGDDDAVHLELFSGDTRKAVVKLGAGLELTVQDDDPAVQLAVGGGKATLTIGADGAVSIESQAKLEVKAAEISLEAQGELKLKGATVNIN